MHNSFTFKNPQRIGCYHSSHTDDISIVVQYRHWHWRYEAKESELVISIPLSATKWLAALPEKYFTLQIQTPIYWFDNRKSFKRKPVYEKLNTNWDALIPDIIDISFTKNDFDGYLNFKQTVNNFHGDRIVSIYQSMQGFWQEFRTLLKQSKTCDSMELNNMLDSMNCKLISYNIDSLTPTYINNRKLSSMYPKLQPEHENQETAIYSDDLPF